MQKRLTLDDAPLKVFLILPALVVALLLPLSFTGALQNVEFWVYDRMLGFQLQENQNSPITLITISDADLTLLKSGSLNDITLSEVLSNILRQRPRAIGIDLYRDIPLPPGTDELAALLNTNPLIVVAQKFGDEHSQGVPPPSYLQSTSQVGCVDFPIDSDNNVRRGLIYLGEDPCYSFAFLLAQRYLAEEGISPSGDVDNPDSLRLGKSHLPRLEANDGGYINMDDRGYQILLDFRNSVTNFPSYSVLDILGNRVRESDIERKIVLIGSVTESGKDFFFTPNVFRDPTQQKTAGVKLHGLFADQLVRAAIYGQQPIGHFPEWLEWLWVWICSVMGVVLGIRKYSLHYFAGILVIGLLLESAGVYMALRYGIWVPLIPCALGLMISMTFSTAWVAHREHVERRMLMNLFSRHVSEAIANEIWQHRRELINGGAIKSQRMIATVFFSDLANFTHIAEAMDPELFVSWLNEYLDEMTNVISRHGGVVIRFIGDAILAGFGIPVPRGSMGLIESDANRAASCALEIQEVLVRLNNDWSSRGLPTVTMRIGLNTGALLAGSLGNTERLEYTIHGDTVNTAARLESYQKESASSDFFVSPCRILISESTRQYLPSSFQCQPFGNLSLKGKDNLTQVFRLVSSKHDIERANRR